MNLLEKRFPEKIDGKVVKIMKEKCAANLFW